MKASDIRKQTPDRSERRAGTMQCDTNMQDEVSFVGYMAREIAAQLAELNQPPAPVNTAEKPTWVQFEYHGLQICIDPSQVSGVQEMPPMPALEKQQPRWCSISLKGMNLYYQVEGTYAEVCAKLGIPVEP